MNDRDLARLTAEQLPWISEQQAEIIIDILFGLIIEGCAIDEKVSLDWFGTFRVSLWYAHHPTGKGKGGRGKLEELNRQPRAGKWFYVPRFRPACWLRAAVNGGRDPNRGCSSCRHK